MVRRRLASRWESLVYHRWVVGDPDEPPERLLRRTRRTLMAAIATANVVGAAVVACFALWALPTPDGIDADADRINLVVAGAYLPAALAVGLLLGRRHLQSGRHGVRDWLVAGRAPDERERRTVLLAPVRVMLIQTALWAVAAALFAGLNVAFSGLLALGVGLTVALGGLTTSAAVYLLTELVLRPVAARALSAGPARRRRLTGVATRGLMVWALGSGVPLVGLVLVGVVALTPVAMSETALAVTLVALGGIGLAFGSLLSLLAIYATVLPIHSIRRGLARVRSGDLAVDLPVWDSTEIGMLQAGFNDMVAGLRERERIRDIFGRQVGGDVARQALAGDVRLGGEVRHVAVLFVDIVGSTGLSATRSPEDVVALLNRFFAEVVDAVEQAGGWINKFEGDAALAIFGAPIGVPEPETCALAAARRLDERLRRCVPELTAGIGVAAGPAVAGHIGAERRFEYTVIGDPVNEAARLTELAKGRAGRVLASGAALEAAGVREGERWRLEGTVELRGRAEPTRLAVPA